MSYRLWIKNEAKSEINQLPGYVRQRIRRTIEDLVSVPRPHSSGEMKSPEEVEVEVRRIRLEQWRVIYIIDEEWSEIGILSIRKRSPYNYEDLSILLQALGE